MMVARRSPNKTYVNAEGVPEISRGLSDQRERYPRSTIKRSRTLAAAAPKRRFGAPRRQEGCKNVLWQANDNAIDPGSNRRGAL